MKRILTATTILVLPVAALAQSPVAVERSGKDLNIGHQQMELPADVLWDSLWIVDDDVCDSGNGAAISGMSIFGAIYDLQCAQAFEVTGDTDITRVVQDYLNFNSSPYSPATDVLVEFFADMGGYPAEIPTFQMTGTVHAEFSIYVSWWDPCTRIEVTFGAGEVTLGAGTHWVSVTPVDITSGGDWYFACRKYEVLFVDAYFRDGGGDHGTLYGGPFGGGYGIIDWASMGDMGFTAGTVSFLVEGSGGGGLALTVIGDCPGTMEACVSGSSEGNDIAIVYGFSAGSYQALPYCPHVFLDIQHPILASRGEADANGEFCCSGNVPPAACGRVLVQAIDLTTCEKTEVVGI